MPSDNDKSDWIASKHACMEAAQSRFVKMNSNTNAGQWVYTYAQTDGPEPPPAWPRQVLHVDTEARLQVAAAGPLYRHARSLRRSGA